MDIAGYPGHDITGLPLFKEREGEAQEVIEQGCLEVKGQLLLESEHHISLNNSDQSNHYTEHQHRKDEEVYGFEEMSDTGDQGVEIKGIQKLFNSLKALFHDYKINSDFTAYREQRLKGNGNSI